MRSVISTGLSAALLATSAYGLDAIGISGQDFVVGTTNDRFHIIGMDYQPGGSSGYDPGSNKDPLSDADICRRDAAVMQMAGSNTLRVYNLNPDLNHDECASIYNAAGIYMVLDVNSPLPNGSIDEDNPGNSYNPVYLNRTFAIVDNFRNYPNTLAFFSANELIHKDTSFKQDPPYIRAVTRDLHQYMRARGGRVVPVGYSAADVREVLADTLSYVSCSIQGEANDESKSDFIGVNGYSWCGATDWHTGQYDQLASIFGSSSIPVFFSEYGCNQVTPRSFNEVGTIYNPQQMPMFSGGLVYQYSEDVNNYGLVNITDDKTLALLDDLSTISSKWAGIDQKSLATSNSTATGLKAPTCSSSLITGGKISNTFKLPAQPSGVSDMIKNGVNGIQGKLVDNVNMTLPSGLSVKWANGSDVQLTLTQKSTSNSLGATTGNLAPGAGSSSGSGSGGSGSGSSTSKAAGERITPAAQAGLFVAGLTYLLSML